MRDFTVENQRARAELDRVGEEILAKDGARSTGDEEKEQGPSAAERLVRLALELFDIGRTTTDEPFAIPKCGPQDCDDVPRVTGRIACNARARVSATGEEDADRRVTG